MIHRLPVNFWVRPPQLTGLKSQPLLGLPKPTQMHSCPLGLTPKLTTANDQQQGLRPCQPEQPDLGLHESAPGRPQHQPLSSQVGSRPWGKSMLTCARDSVEATGPLPHFLGQTTEVWVQECPPGSPRAGRQPGPQKLCSQHHTGDGQTAGALLPGH